MQLSEYRDHFFFFNETATTEIYTLSLHDAIPIWLIVPSPTHLHQDLCVEVLLALRANCPPEYVVSIDLSMRVDRRNEPRPRSEEHTSELQSRQYLVCRLLLEKKKKTDILLHSTYS